MNDLILEVIKSYNAYLSKLPVGCKKIAEQFRIDQIQEALNGIKNFTEGVIWMADASELLKLNEIAVDFELGGIQVFLTEVNDALAIQDYNLVADIFEYELVNYFEDTPFVQLEQ